MLLASNQNFRFFGEKGIYYLAMVIFVLSNIILVIYHRAFFIGIVLENLWLIAYICIAILLFVIFTDFLSENKLVSK